jgi:SAM-dependent methyltransferase
MIRLQPEPIVVPFDLTDFPHETVACNQCGSDTHFTVAIADRYGLPVTTVECGRFGCGLQYINPRMTADGYATFYQEHYRPLLSALQGSPYTPAMVRENSRKYATELVKDVAAVVEPYPGSSLLDLGGSTGIVARQFAERWDCRCTVVDPSPEEVAQARDFAITQCATAEDATFAPGSFDVILLCRTIEHLLDPKAVLRRARMWATARAFLVVDAMDTAKWNDRSRYKVDHPYAFTATTLERMVTSAGWRVRGTWTRNNGKYVGLICSPEE